MGKHPFRWLAVALVLLLGALLLTTYSATSRPEELLLFHGRVKELLRCPLGTSCAARISESRREWHLDVQTAPLNVDKLEAGSITWTPEAADAVIAEVVQVQFPADCKGARWLAIQQLSDDVLYDYQKFLALLVFGVSLGYTVVPIHDSPMAPYATCKEKSLHCYFRPFTNCSLYSEPGRLKMYGDAFYDYTHGRDFLHQDMGKVLRGDWGDGDLLIIPYEAHYPNERPYREEWIFSMWERLSAAGLASVFGGGEATQDHIEAMVFSIVSDWMFKPVGRIQDVAVEMRSQQGQMKQPLLGVHMPTRFEGGPERFDAADQVDVLAYDGKKMKRVLKDLKWAYKAASDNVGHHWNSTYLVTDSDYLLGELLRKPDTVGAASAESILFDKLEVTEMGETAPDRRLLEGRGSPPGTLARGRRLRAKVRANAPSNMMGEERSSSSSSLAEEIDTHSVVQGEGQLRTTSGDREEFGIARQRYSRSRQPSEQSPIAALAIPWWACSRRVDPFKSSPADDARLEGSRQRRRTILQEKSEADSQPSNTVQPSVDERKEEALDKGSAIGLPESGEDWSALEELRASEDRALANALLLARLSDYAVLSCRTNTGRLVAQVLSARKRATQVGPLGPVVHSSSAGTIVNPLGASGHPRLPLGTLRWSNVAEKLVYEELDRTQFPQDCEQARWLLVKLNTQGLALNFHSYQMALVLAMSLGRTLVIEPSEAAPSEAATCVVDTLETLFEPLSSCKYSNTSSTSGDDATLSWDDAMMTVSEARVVRLESVVPNQPGFADRGEVWVEPSWWPAFLENLIAAGNLRVEGGGGVHKAPFLDLHFVLWSITTQWMWRPQQRILQIVDAIKCAWPDQAGPTIAVHVRQTDRGWGDGYYREHQRYRDIAEYGRAIESLEADWGLKWPSMFLFTDTASVLRQASANASRLGFSDSDRQVMYNPLVELDPITVHTSHLNVPCRQRNQILQHYIAEMTFAAENADYAVFAGSASGARIVWELMAAHRQFAQTKAQGDLVHSLDTGWYYEW